MHNSASLDHVSQTSTTTLKQGRSLRKNKKQTPENCFPNICLVFYAMM